MVALATGIKLRGDMRYRCKTRRLTARPQDRQYEEKTYTVVAGDPHDAARNAAQVVADHFYGETGVTGFLTRRTDGTDRFIVSVGEQRPDGKGGITTVGFSVIVEVTQ